MLRDRTTACTTQDWHWSDQKVPSRALPLRRIPPTPSYSLFSTLPGSHGRLARGGASHHTGRSWWLRGLASPSWDEKCWSWSAFARFRGPRGLYSWLSLSCCRRWGGSSNLRWAPRRRIAILSFQTLSSKSWYPCWPSYCSMSGSATRSDMANRRQWGLEFATFPWWLPQLCLSFLGGAFSK